MMLTADQRSQKEAADLYDADPQNWSRRVAVAMEIVQVGLDTGMRRGWMMRRREIPARAHLSFPGNPARLANDKLKVIAHLGSSGWVNERYFRQLDTQTLIFLDRGART